MPRETIELTGHIVDSLLLAKVLDTIVEAGVAYEVVDVEIGRTNLDPSTARIHVDGAETVLDRLIDELQVHGVTRVSAGAAPAEPAAQAGRVPGPERDGQELSWGRRYLMCPPQHFGVLYEINPWMHDQVAVDHDVASAQWEGLVANLRLAGAEVVMMDPHPSVPDLVFTANAGIVNGRQFVPSHFRHPERRGETEIDAAWFAARGFEVERLPAEITHEGAGDALPFTPEGGDTVLVSGYSFRSDAAATTDLARLLRCPVKAVRLVDPLLYHVDLTFCPLDERHAICAPMGWDRYGRTLIDDLVPEPLWLENEEALAFCANSVVVGRTVLMPTTPPRVGRQLEAWGFSVVETPVGEFLKAGGGCRCLTLALDTILSPTIP